MPQKDADTLDGDALDAAADQSDVRVRRDTDGRCVTSADCVDTVGTPACDTAAGRCVRCTAAEDSCPADEHCDDAAHLCVPGCRSDEGCNSGGGDAGRMRYCNVATRACVACLRDEHCVRGYCENGGCVPWCEPDRGCGPSQTCCTRTCADLMSNPMHCGACGAACPAAARALATCVSGACSLRCEAGFADCNMSAADGCEVNTRTAANNCGGCGTVCPSRPNAGPACVAGACSVTCNAGFGNCNLRPDDGCEIDTRASNSNCGACGAICTARANANAACSGGMCRQTCVAPFVDCNGNSADGCETDVTANVANCGACGRTCGFLQGCAANDCSYTGLVSYWAFNGNGNDAVGGRTLRLVGGLGYGGGVFGQGLNFANRAAFVADRTVSDAVFDLSAGDFSLQLWVNFNGVSTGQQLMVERGGGVEGWMFSRLADGSLEWRGTPSAVLTTTAITIPSGVWHHLVVRRRGTTFAMFYDGASVVTATTPTAITATREALCVGRRYGGTNAPRRPPRRARGLVARAHRRRDHRALQRPRGQARHPLSAQGAVLHFRGSV